MIDSPIVTRSISRRKVIMAKPDEGDSVSKLTSLTSSPETIPVHKWNLTYDGSAGVRGFIERVEELAQSRHVSTASLFSSAVELFSGDALNWFRVNRSSFKSWADIVVALKEEFELLDHERRLLQQIRSTYQQQRENLGSYITRVLLLNNRLSSKLPDDEILELLQCNMLPRYIQKLSLSVIPDLISLKKFGKMIELADSRSDTRNGTPDSNVNNSNSNNSTRNNTVIRSDNRYVGRNNSHNNNTNFRNDRQFYNRNFSQSNVNSREVRCFRCGRPGVKAPSCSCRRPKN